MTQFRQYLGLAWAVPVGLTTFLVRFHSTKNRRDRYVFRHFLAIPPFPIPHSLGRRLADDISQAPPAPSRRSARSGSSSASSRRAIRSMLQPERRSSTILWLRGRRRSWRTRALIIAFSRCRAGSFHPITSPRPKLGLFHVPPGDAAGRALDPGRTHRLRQQPVAFLGVLLHQGVPAGPHGLAPLPPGQLVDRVTSPHRRSRCSSAPPGPAAGAPAGPATPRTPAWPAGFPRGFQRAWDESSW